MPGFQRFGRTWASGGAVSAPSDTQFAQGFSFLGNTPPSVELFNAMFQERDEQANWLYAQLRTLLQRAGITPAPTPDTQVADAMSRLFGGGSQGLSYVFLPGGKIMQWGQNGVLLSAGFNGIGEAFRDILFPIAFPRACMNVQATARDISGTSAPNEGSSLQETAWILSHSNTGARIAASARAAGMLMTFDWLAIGE